jgi:hypothetical protein
LRGRVGRLYGDMVYTKRMIGSHKAIREALQPKEQPERQRTEACLA